MPTYEYTCTKCGEKVEIQATLQEKKKGLDVSCQLCGSRKMARVFGNVSVGRSGGPKPPQCGPGCCCGS